MGLMSCLFGYNDDDQAILDRLNEAYDESERYIVAGLLKFFEQYPTLDPANLGLKISLKAVKFWSVYDCVQMLASRLCRLGHKTKPQTMTFQNDTSLMVNGLYYVPVSTLTAEIARFLDETIIGQIEEGDRLKLLNWLKTVCQARPNLCDISKHNQIEDWTI